MTNSDKQSSEGVGAHYDRAMMLETRARTRKAIHDIAAQIHPGMVEEDAVALARDVLKAADMLRGWHGIYVRFGSNTLKTFGDKSEPGKILGADDIFFIDIGPIWKHWEGDGGETFTTGTGSDFMAAKRDVRILFDRVHDKWRTDHSTGVDLYTFAEQEAERMGWRLNLDLSGHRLADFPHSVIHKGALANADFTPATDLWVLEMHIRHPDRPFGAFFEDLLLSEAA